MLDGNGYAIIVDRVVQQEKKTVLNEAKYKVGMEKWSKENMMQNWRMTECL